VGVTQQPFVGIALNDAIALALVRNTDLIVSAENRRIAGYRIVAAEGAYDVRFAVTPSYQYQVTAPLSPFQAGPGGGPITQTTGGLSGSFSGQTQSGTQFAVGYSGEGLRSNNTANGFNPYYQSALSFNVTQPLLRGRFTEARRQLELARINAAAASDSTALTASNTITSVAETYWDLVAAWRNVAIQEEALRQVQAQAQSNERLVRRGAAAPVEVVESNTQVSVYQDNVLSGLQNVARLQNQLKQTMLADPADPIWMANLVPTSPAKDLPREPSLGDVLLAALRNRPEVAQLAEERRQNDVELAYARDQARPQVDVNLGYTSNGFAGEPASLLANPIFSVFGPVFTSVDQLIAYADMHGAKIPPLHVTFPSPPPAFIGGLGTAMTNLLANRLPAVALSVTVGVPLRNRTARANLAVAQEQQQQLTVQQAALVQRIAFEARNALQTLQAARSRLVAARAGRIAAERVYSSEQRKFRAGTSTTFLVLQRQTDVATQRGRELQAQTDLNKAVVELDRVSGTILDSNGFTITSAGSGPVPVTTLPARPSPAPAATLSPLP
ncbi:MAG: TolC family protein, partial [Candidatus Eremiobacteraeota bacterium]|nr:TolC family protein [Candidatus Eremiobacteraeota bacterium]